MTAAQANTVLQANGVTVVYATEGKRSARFWKKYHPNMEAAYQIPKGEAVRYCPALA